MRIVGIDEFLSLPAGTLYAEIREPWRLDQLEMKEDSEPDIRDWWRVSLAWVDAEETGMAIDRLDEMAADSSVSYPMEWTCSRDGLYDSENRRFLVYEPADTRALIEQISRSLDHSAQSPYL